MQLDDQTVSLLRERGARAKALLASSVFQEAMKDLEHYHVTAMVSALPGDKEREACEYHHQQLHSLREVVSTLTGYVDASEELAEQLGDEPEYEEIL